LGKKTSGRRPRDNHFTRQYIPEDNSDHPIHLAAFQIKHVDRETDVDDFRESTTNTLQPVGVTLET
jgi:hypothetical protein